MSKKFLEVDRANIDVIKDLLPPVFVGGIQSFLGDTSFYKLFIKDLLKVSRTLYKLLEKDVKFNFDVGCLKVFEELKHKLVSILVMIASD